MSGIFAFDPYADLDDGRAAPAKVANPAKVAEIRDFPEAKAGLKLAKERLNEAAAPDSGPSDADEEAFVSEERTAVQAESAGTPTAPVPHPLPPSWSDATIEPTAGARCRCCSGSGWWTEAWGAKGWRCAVCYPPSHLKPEQRREVRT